MPKEDFETRINRQIDEASQRLDVVLAKDELDPDFMNALKKARGELRALEQLKLNPPWKATYDAMFIGDLDGVKKHTDNGRLVKVWTEEGGIPLLMQPAYTGDDEILDFLIANGADPDLGRADGLSPLACAVMKDNASTFEKLVKAGANTDVVTKAGDTLIKLAEYNGADDVLKILNDKAAMAALKPQKAALREGFEACVKRLRDELNSKIEEKRGLSFDDPKCIALRDEVSNRIGKLEDMIENPPWKAFEYAMIRGDLASMKEHTDNGRLVKVWNDEERLPMLLQPALRGKDDVIDFLIKNGADPNLGRLDGMTPLAYAAMQDHLSTFRKLVKAGAKVDVITKAGDTLEKLAEYNGSEKILKLLRDEKAMAALMKPKKAPKGAAPKK